MEELKASLIMSALVIAGVIAIAGYFIVWLGRKSREPGQDDS